MSAAGKIRCSAIVWGFLHFAILRATRYDAFSAFSLIFALSHDRLLSFEITQHLLHVFNRLSLQENVMRLHMPQ